MSDIYLSYALADQDRAQKIVEGLRAAGHSVWWDRDIPAGAERKAAIGEALEAAKLAMFLWSNASVAATDVLDEAEVAKAKGSYLGVMLDKVELPFGFGGYDPVDVAPFSGSAGEVATVAAAVKEFMETGQSAPEALPPPPPPPPPKKNPLIFVAVGAAVVIAALIGFVVWRSSQPTLVDIVSAQLTATPCAWLRVDPVLDGRDGKLGLTGVAGDPAAAGVKVKEIVDAKGLGIESVSVDKVAQIDGRECAAIDEPLKLRKSPGGRLFVTGEPFLLDSSLAKPQALTRVNINLDAKDKTMALFGVEPSGVVTWAVPDLETLESLKGLDIGYTNKEPGKYEFSIYPDHLGWTGLFVVVGDSPLAEKKPQGTVQSSAEFAKTLRAATAKGEWDADMVWFRIDPK